MSGWVRLWHDMPTDPKWRTIARKSGQPISAVIAVFTMMMVNASANTEERGTIKGFEPDDVASALDIEPEDVAAILAAMQGKVIDGGRLSGWTKRQIDCAHGSNSSGTKSYLYVIANSGSRELKIGTSRNPWARAKDLQTATTGRTTVVATFSGTRSDETTAHQILAKYRKSGEWFALPRAIHQFIVAQHNKKLSAEDFLSELREWLRSSDSSYEDSDTDTDSDIIPPTEGVISPKANDPAPSNGEADQEDEPVTAQEVIDGWNALAARTGLAPVRKLTGDRKRKLAARLRDCTFDEFAEAIRAIERSSFCRGQNDRGWRANFDFLLQPSSFAKLIEGHYDDGPQKPH